jgi:hypothetical protein
MARLYDDIRAGAAYRAHLGSDLADWFEGATVLVADNVTEYYYAVSDREVWELEDFPNVAPPFSTFFIETRRPTCIRSEGVILDWNQCRNPGHPKTATRPTRWGAWITVLDRRAARLMDDGSDELVAAGAGKWVIGVTLWLDTGLVADSLGEPIWTWTFVVGANGLMVRNPKHPSGAGFSSIPLGWVADSLYAATRIFDATPEALASELFGYLKPLFLALCFLHCKNVKQVVHTPPPKLVKARAKRGRAPLCTYRVLDIQPMRKVLVREGGGESGEAGRRAFHIVRGHFKSYTAEKPLLGHSVGTWWWPMHVAGSKRQGVVVKDYTVEAPAHD